MARQIRKLIVAFEMNFEGRAPSRPEELRAQLKSAGLTLIGTTDLVYDRLAPRVGRSRTSASPKILHGSAETELALASLR
jgi:hypothetical protein